MNPPPFTIRAAVANDWTAATEVVRAVYDEYGFTWDEADYHADLYNLAEFYLDKGHRFWIAETDEGPVGTAALEIFDPIPGLCGGIVQYEGASRIGGCDCALQRLYVVKSGRRSGVGSALMKMVVDTARQLEKRNLEIWSDKRFVEAHRLYGKADAITVGDRICHDPDQSPEWGLYIPI